MENLRRRYRRSRYRGLRLCTRVARRACAPASSKATSQAEARPPLAWDTSSVMDDSPAQLQLTRFGRTLWQQLSPELPGAVEYETCGTLWIAADEQEMAEVHAKKTTYNAIGVRADILDEAQVAAEEPNLRRGLAGALLVPDDAVIYPPAASDWLLQQALAHGATLLQGAAAVSAARGTLHLGDGTVLHSERIVLATGADCALLPALPIKKRKGHLLITDRYPDFLHHQLVELGYLKSAHKLEADSVAFKSSHV